jgi:hypothetical protein
MRVVELGPEESNESVAAMESKRSVNSEITEEGKQLRSPEDRAELAAIGIPEIQSPQHPEPDHSADLVGERR